MEDIEVRPVRKTDASELAMLLNEIISRGGTTALEEPFTPDGRAGDAPVAGFSVARSRTALL
jgi:hypothetical protein